MQFVVRAPENLIREIDKKVDGKMFKSRNQLVNIALAEWLAREYFPDDEELHAKERAGIYSANGHFSISRHEYKMAILGDDWDKFKHANAQLFEDPETSELYDKVKRIEKFLDKLHTRTDTYGQLYEQVATGSETRLEKIEQRLAALESKLSQISSEPATQPEEPQNESRKSKRGQATKPKRSK